MQEKYKVDVYVMPDWTFKLVTQPDPTDRYLRTGLQVENADLSAAIAEMTSLLNALRVTKWEQRIVVWIELDKGWQGELNTSVGLALKRVERGESDDGQKFTREKSGYVSKGWPTEGRHRSTRDGRDLPYSKELWDALIQANKNLKAIGKKLTDLMYKTEEAQLVTMIVAGRALPAPS